MLKKFKKGDKVKVKKYKRRPSFWNSQGKMDKKKEKML